MPKIKAENLRHFSQALLAKGGFTQAEAGIVADSLVAADLRGYASHGVMRLPFYVQMIADEVIQSEAPLEILQEGVARLVADAHWGIGQVQASLLVSKLTEKVQQQGLAVGTLRQCGHIGRLGAYCEEAAESNLVSMVMVNSHGAVVRVAPPGGKAPRLSTNPLAIGVPNGESPLILDFSTSVTAEGKVRVKQIAGEACPPGWLIDSDGQPTTNPNALYAEPPGSILPVGGPQAYKGFGLGLMIDILCGALSGGLVAREKPFDKKGNCVFMLLLDPEAFGGE